MSGPHNLEAEQAILGALLCDETGRVAEACEGLRGAHFYEPLHGRLYDETLRRVRAGAGVDMIRLREWVENDGGFVDIGGPGYLLDLCAAAAPLTSQVTSYAAILRDTAARRAVIALASEAIGYASSGLGDAHAHLETQLAELALERDDADAWEPLGAMMHAGIREARAGGARGLSTGIDALDRCTGGVRPGTLWVIGGATSMGKSVVGPAISRAIAREGRAVAEFHLEMDRTQIGLRAASALAFRLNARNPFYLSAMRNKLDEEQWGDLERAAADGAALPIYVDARPGRTVAQIEAAARRLFRRLAREQRRPGLILVDHEGLIAPAARHPNELEAARARAHGLLEMAKRLEVGVIALSQITKDGARFDGEDRLPSLLDLNYGSALSQAADVVILIHRKGYYAERKPREARSAADLEALRSRETILVVDKARGGQRAQVNVCLDLPTAAVFEAGRAA